MPFRSIVLLHFGQPFGGFRLALRAGIFGINNKKAYESLEKTIDAIFDVYKKTPFEEWSKLNEDDSLNKLLPEIGNSLGAIDFSFDTGNNQCREITARGSISFSLWRMGGWVVHDGIRIDKDTGASKFSEIDLSEIW
jgi:hypothetical protein